MVKKKEQQEEDRCGGITIMCVAHKISFFSFLFFVLSLHETTLPHFHNVTRSFLLDVIFVIL